MYIPCAYFFHLTLWLCCQPMLLHIAVNYFAVLHWFDHDLFSCIWVLIQLGLISDGSVMNKTTINILASCWCTHTHFFCAFGRYIKGSNSWDIVGVDCAKLLPKLVFLICNPVHSVLRMLLFHIPANSFFLLKICCKSHRSFFNSDPGIFLL